MTLEEYIKDRKKLDPNHPIYLHELIRLAEIIQAEIWSPPLKISPRKLDKAKLIEVARKAGDTFADS